MTALKRTPRQDALSIIRGDAHNEMMQANAAEKFDPDLGAYAREVAAELYMILETAEAERAK